MYLAKRFNVNYYTWGIILAQNRHTKAALMSHINFW